MLVLCSIRLVETATSHTGVLQTVCFNCLLSHLAVISGSSASLKHSLYIRNFLIYVLLKTSLKDFEYNLASM